MTSKARGPEILSIPSQRKFVAYPSGNLRVVPCKPIQVFYPDRRLAPRICDLTGIRRSFCCCSACRSLRRRKHRAACRCWLCFADRTGSFIDALGKRTRAGRWALFLTLTYRTENFPWQRGFPIAQPQPHSDFVRHFIAYMIRCLEGELSDRIEYFQAEQFGSIGGRIHQHMGLSSPALMDPARQLAENLAAQNQKLPEQFKSFQAFLWKRAGYNRILPWEMDAGYYIGRYIGRDAHRCDWDWNVGAELLAHAPEAAPVGRVVVARSPDLPSANYRNVLHRRHR
jgi:hypothetical protein